MYCKKCGAVIADDSIYCSKCGQKQNESNMSYVSPITESKTKKIKLWPFIVIFTLFLSILLLRHYVINMPVYDPTNDNQNTSNNSNKLLSRKAQTSDVITSNENTNISTFTYDFTITPQKDIKSLVIKVIFLDKNGNELGSKEKNIGNVKEGIQTEVKIHLQEIYHYWDDISQIKFRVIGGEVTYLQ